MDVEIELGARICSNLKHIYHPNDEWHTCYKEIGGILSVLKKSLGKFYGYFKEKTYLTKEESVEILKQLQTYGEVEIKEALEIAVANVEEKKGPSKPKYGDNVVWIPVPVDKPELVQKVKEMLKTG